MHLAGPVVQEWVNRHEQHFRCDAGRRGVCSYPRDNLHFQDCGYYRPLPPELEIPFESIGQSHGHAFRSQDAEAQYYDNEFFDGYDDGYFNLHHSRGHLFHSRHEDEENGHLSQVFHGGPIDKYDESHLIASHFDADFSGGDDSIPAAFGRPRGPTTTNRGSSGTTNRPESRPNVYHRHHGRNRK